jgi:hypothetical protein
MGETTTARRILIWKPVAKVTIWRTEEKMTG